MGFIILASKVSGFKCSDLGSFAKENFGVQENKKEEQSENFGVQEKHKKERNIIPSGCGVRAMVIHALPFILVSRLTLLFR